MIYIAQLRSYAGYEILGAYSTNEKAQYRICDHYMMYKCHMLSIVKPSVEEILFAKTINNLFNDKKYELLIEEIKKTDRYKYDIKSVELDFIENLSRLDDKFFDDLLKKQVFK